MYIEESGQCERNTYNMEAERKLEEKNYRTFGKHLTA